MVKWVPLHLTPLECGSNTDEYLTILKKFDILSMMTHRERMRSEQDAVVGRLCGSSYVTGGAKFP